MSLALTEIRRSKLKFGLLVLAVALLVFLVLFLTTLSTALVRSITQRHGGTVHCEDAPGGGACFVVTLPCNQL